MAQDYIDEMRASRQRPSVLKIRWIGFVQAVRCPRILVVEGKEDKIVYDRWISKSDLCDEFEFFIAEGKRNALKLHEFVNVDEDSKNFDVYFVVDRDFDDNSAIRGVPRIFVLPFYSIENYLVCKEVLSRSLRVAFSLDGFAKFREDICRQFEEDYDAFLTVTADWNREIFIARRLKLNIDDKIPNALDVIATAKYGEIGAGTGNPDDLLSGARVSKEDRDKLEILFSDLAPRYRYRGKFALKFLRVWLSSLIGVLKAGGEGEISVPAGCQPTVEHTELTLGGFACRSAVPDGLAEYLPKG